MFQTIYYVDKRTGTSADVLLAAGFAELVRQVLFSVGKPTDDLRLVDSGPRYQIEVPVPIEDTDIEQIEYLPLVRHLDITKNKAKLGTHFGQGFPYEAEQQRKKEYQAKRNELPSEAKTPNAYLTRHPALEQLMQNITPPDPELSLYSLIYQMLKDAALLNKPILRWRELPPELLRVHIRLLLNLFSASPNPLEKTISQWEQFAKKHHLGDANMTMYQVINPCTGKGANQTKASGVTTGDQLEEFWVVELLKFAGFFMLAHPQQILSPKTKERRDDRKTYVLHPSNMRLSLIDAVMRDFRKVLWSSTPVKLDILAVLQLTRVLIEHDRRALKRESGTRRPVRKPTERVHGFDVTFYKDMRNAHAVMNVATLNVPDWIPGIKTVADADQVLAILNEHVEVIRSIRAVDKQTRTEKEGTEEHELLRRYRDFLSGRTIEPFLDFAALFAPYLSQKIERKEYTRRFSTTTLEELIAMTKHDFMPVIQSEGFQNIAAAIRRSTVSLQYAKGMGKAPGFDIRYGLAQELIRQSNYPDEFIAALSDFVARYNLETAQTFETSKGKLGRKRVTENDLAEIVELLAQGFSSKTIARLLVAFGSAKTSEDPTDSATSRDETPLPQFESEA